MRESGLIPIKWSLQSTLKKDHHTWTMLNCRLISQAEASNEEQLVSTETLIIKVLFLRCSPRRWNLKNLKESLQWQLMSFSGKMDSHLLYQHLHMSTSQGIELIIPYVKNPRKHLSPVGGSSWTWRVQTRSKAKLQTPCVSTLLTKHWPQTPTEEVSWIRHRKPNQPTLLTRTNDQALDIEAT